MFRRLFRFINLFRKELTDANLITSHRNAKTAGMQDEFNITSSQYSVIVLIFFVSYTIFEIPSNMILVRVRPSIYLSSLAVLWGVIVCSTAATKNWEGVAGCRFALGAAEAGFAAGCAFYLSSWYRTHELAARFAVIYTSVALAGGLSGLLAGVITEHMDGTNGIPGWKWLFVGHGEFFLILDNPILI